MTNNNVNPNDILYEENITLRQIPLSLAQRNFPDLKCNKDEVAVYRYEEHNENYVRQIFIVVDIYKMKDTHRAICLTDCNESGCNRRELYKWCVSCHDYPPGIMYMPMNVESYDIPENAIVDMVDEYHNY